MATGQAIGKHYPHYSPHVWLTIADHSHGITYSLSAILFFFFFSFFAYVSYVIGSKAFPRVFWGKEDQGDWLFDRLDRLETEYSVLRTAM